MPTQPEEINHLTVKLFPHHGDSEMACQVQDK